MQKTLSPTNLKIAIDSGLKYLHQAQQPAGDFLTYASPQVDMTEAKPYPKTVYLSTFVIHSLCYVGSHPLVEPIQQQAAKYLLSEQQAGGVWYYDQEGREQKRIPPDSDDLACATAALLKVGHRPNLSFYQLLWDNEVTPGGPYYTWLNVDHSADTHFAQDVDALVNANILFCCALLGLTPTGAIDYLRQVIQNEAYKDSSVYCISPHLPIYALSRAYKDGPAMALQPSVPIIKSYILTKLPPPEAELSVFNLACSTVSLLNFHTPLADVEAYLSVLLNHQQADGAWPAWAAHFGYHNHYDGSPALTTALALEALGKYWQLVTTNPNS